MTNLLIDIGNSNCKVAFEEQGELGEIFRSAQLDILRFILSVIGEKELNVIVLSNVREEDKEMERVLRSKCKKLIILDTNTKLPVNISYGFPEEGLGADRLAGAIASITMFPGKDCLKFDFGTALTVDYITREDRKSVV